jgi:hypothetical protein
MTNVIRLFMLFEATTFVVAALFHSGILIPGYQHQEASTAESVIAIVLLVGAALTWIRPAWTRQVGLVAQSLALFGTLIGVFVIAIGVGPRTVPDVAYHIGIVIVLVLGLIVAARARADRATNTTG